MQFADRLVGKGLGAWIITKLIILNLGWIVVLVIPMAVLVATLMAFGNMAQNNEVAVMKATGISLYKMMISPFLASIVITLLLIEFNNNVYPDANHELKILMQDISRKKPTLSLVPGVFSQEMPGYAILAREIEPETNKLKGITIYDNSEVNKTNVITAESGRVYFLYIQKKLMMDLKNGEIHNYDLTKTHSYTKIRFKDHRIAMNGEQFTFQRSDGGTQSRSDRELGAPALMGIVDSLGKINNTFKTALEKTRKTVFNPDKKTLYFSAFQNDRKTILYSVRNEITSNRYLVGSDIRRVEERSKEINEYLVEAHKKYSLPVACIVFILIGAPLGTMTRKGGFGFAAGISLLFFLVYWIFLMGGEKLADRNLLTPFWGIWSANFVMGILGIYLTYKSAREKVTLDFSFINKLIPKFVKQIINPDADKDN